MSKKKEKTGSKIQKGGIMTINEIKENLPDVKLLRDGKAYTGNIRGKKLKFAKVLIVGTGVDITASWEAIARAINSNTPVII